MAYISQYEYYENGGVVPEDKNWGSYQFISLQDIVNNFLLMYSGNHSLVNNEERYKVLFHAKRAIQELNYDAFKKLGLEFNDVVKNMNTATPKIKQNREVKLEKKVEVLKIKVDKFIEFNLKTKQKLLNKQ